VDCAGLSGGAGEEPQPSREKEGDEEREERPYTWNCDCLNDPEGFGLRAEKTGCVPRRRAACPEGGRRAQKAGGVPRSRRGLSRSRRPSQD
jgi:hypothetical protein